VTQFLRFLFPAAAQKNIDATKIATADTPYSESPSLTQPYPQSLMLTFPLAAGATGPPPLQPLLPGELRFIASPAASGSTPNPAVDSFVRSAYSGWKVEGTLMVRAADATPKRLTQLGSGLPVLPSVFWYSPVVLTEDFLFDTLGGAAGLKRWVVGDKTTEAKPTDPDWAKRAVFAFLRGEWGPLLDASDANPAKHDVAKHPLPTVKTVAGNVALTVTAAARAAPQDAPDQAFDELGMGSDDSLPRHPRNGAIPARAVYRALRPQLLDAPPGNQASPSVADRVLADWPAERRYFTIRFTRTWLPKPNCSVHFPDCTARVLDTADNPLAAQRLPAHGVVFLEQPPAATPPPAPKVKLALDGALKVLKGEQAAAWRHKAAFGVLEYDLAQVPSPHVIARRPFADELLTERAWTPGGPKCTYMTLRRFTRAMVDHRITGGRLNQERERTSADTLALLDAAFKGTGVSKSALANNQPAPETTDLEAAGTTLRAVLEAIFPDPAPTEVIGGSDKPDPRYTKGKVAYYLWQSGYEEFEKDATKRAFPSAHVGRGGAGAAVYLGLASYAVNVARGSETPQKYADDVVAEIKKKNLKPGAVLQLWEHVAGFDMVSGRSVGTGVSPLGHSPVFASYELGAGAAVVGFDVVDQARGTQPRQCPLDKDEGGSERFFWDGSARDVWFGASWDE
jgi:hypothetical protein